MGRPNERDLQDKDTPLDSDQLMPDEKIDEIQKYCIDSNMKDMLWLCQTARSARYFADLWEHSLAQNKEPDEQDKATN